MTHAHPRTTFGSLCLGLIAAVVAATTLAGCQPVPIAPPPDAVSAATPARRGTLIIAGGAIADDNQAPWRALVAGSAPDGSVGILPTASGVPDEAVGNATRAVAGLGFDPLHAVEVPIRAGDTAAADSLESVRLIDALGAVWISGGDQSRVVETLTNGQRERPALLALRRLLARGGSIGGSSAGAAVMSRTMLLGGDSESWLRTLLIENAPGKLRLGTGLGFADGFIADQHFFERGRFGRLLAACMASSTKVGIGIGENRFVTVDRQSGRITAGPGHAALLMDCTKAKFDGKSISGVRISLLADGTVADLSRPTELDAARLTPGQGWSIQPQTGLQARPAAALPAVGSETPTVTLAEAFGKRQLLEALRALWAGAPCVRLESRAMTVTLLATPTTSRLAADSAANPAAWSIHGVELRVVAKDR